VSWAVTAADQTPEGPTQPTPIVVDARAAAISVGALAVGMTLASATPVLVAGASLEGLAVSLWRLWIPAVVFAAITAGRHRHSWTLLRLTARAGICFGGATALYFSAVQLTSVANATLITVMQPLPLVIAARFMFAERIGLPDLGWIALALGGATVMVLSADSGGTADIRGDLIAAGATVVSAGYFIFGKRARATLDTDVFMTGLLFWAGLTIAPIALSSGQDVVPAPVRPRAREWPIATSRAAEDLVATSGVAPACKIGSMAEESLFAGNHLRDVLRAQHDRLEVAIRDLDADVVLATPAENLEDEMVSKFEVPCPVLWHDDRYSPGATDTQIDVSGDFRRATLGAGPHYVAGTKFSLHIPFDGERQVFLLRPSTFSMNPPAAEISNQELILTVEAPADSLDPAAVRSQLEDRLRQIETLLETARADVEEYNNGLRESARSLLDKRRQKVLADRALDEVIAVPIKRRDNRSQVLAVDVPKKRQPMRANPVTTAQPLRPEPAIGREDFEAIVGVISSFAAAAERFPQTFGPMNEEVLRELVLVILNNQFGPAVGELFSRVGKTDIAVLQTEGPVFIAECKIWHGPASFDDAIDQLLGYLVWRDTKAALVIFVKNVDVSAVVEKAHEMLRGHARFKRDAPTAEGLPDAVLHHEGDVNREIEVALVMVPIPQADAGG
jgi:drug/metabolite transporter (DMT)-like permease